MSEYVVGQRVTVVGLGPCTIVAVMPEMVVVEGKGGARNVVPLARAGAMIRPVMSEAEIARVFQALRDPPGSSGGMFGKRDGTAVELAELARDLSARAFPAPKDAAEIARAVDLIAAAIAIARGHDTATVRAEIVALLPAR